jgi:hypothetical protein
VPIVFADAQVAAETGQAGRCDAPVLAEQLDRACGKPRRCRRA